MRYSTRAALLGALVLGGITSHPASAVADSWPIARHDAARTGASAGAVPVQKPVVTWRAYMGGRPTARTVRFGLGNPSIIVASAGGRFIARNAVTQATLWSSALLGVGWVEAIEDIDNSGGPEVVVRTENNVHILNGITGKTMWTSPEADFRSPVAVRVLDLNGDGHKDVYIDECTGCAKVGALSAGAYQFASGFGVASALWKRPADAKPQPLNSGTDALIDLDNNGIPEVILPSWDEVLVVSGSSGAPITTLTVPLADAHPFPHADALAAEIDGQPFSELVVVQRNGQVSSKVGPPSISVFKVDPQLGTSTLLYRKVTPGFDAELVPLVDLVKDLDGDGLDEVIFSHHAQGGAWTTEILQGSTGNVVAQLDGARFEGAADLDGEPGAEVVVATAEGLSVHKLGASGLTQVAGPLPGVRAYALPDPALWNHGQLDRRLAVLPRPGRPSALLVGHPASTVAYADLITPANFLDIQSVTLGASGAKLGKPYSPIIGEITDIVIANNATRPYPQVAVGTTAGTIDVLDQSLKGTNGIVFLNGKATGTLFGGAVQPSTGASGGPLIGEDDAGPFVVLPGSPLGLYVGDARFASLILPPLPRWIHQGTHAPSILDLGPLGAAVVGVEGHRLVARQSADGVEISGVDLGPGKPQSTPLPLRVKGELAPRVGIDWETGGVQAVQSAVDFTSGAVVWQGEPLPFGGFFGSGVGDLDGDGTDEWYSMNGPLNRRDAKTGGVTATSGNAIRYALPMAASFTGAGAPELLLQSGAAPPRLLKADLSSIWQAPGGEPVNGMAGARVVCPGGPRFVTPSTQSPVLRAFHGASGQLAVARVLAGGAGFASVEEALAAGKIPGTLSNATSVASLAGGGPAVLVGSSDGYLYAVNACSLDVVWAKNLGASASEPIVGDTDGDGADEIVVGAADGFVYCIDTPVCAPPTWVKAAGPSEGNSLQPGEKVDVSFEPVASATSYEIALVGPDEQALWDPAYWYPADQAATETHAQVSLEGALANRPYRVAVRAKNEEGASPDVFSEPFFIIDTSPPTIDVDPSGAGSAVRVAISATDDLALSHYLVWMGIDGMGEDGALVAADDRLDGAAAKVEALIEPPQSLWGQKIWMRVDVVDSAGNNKSRAFTAVVDANGQVGSNVVPDAAAPPLLDPSLLKLGCACRAAGTGAPDAAAWASGAAFALGLALARRRRHTRTR